MGTRKRKPLSDITDIHNNLKPLSLLRELVASNGICKPPVSISNGICKPPVSILKSNSNSTNHKFYPESSNRSNTSIGSSIIGATINSKTVRFRQPPPALSATTYPGDIGTENVAYNRRHNSGKSNKERDTHVIVNHTSIEKRKDKGKAVARPLSSSASEKAKDTQNKIRDMAHTDGGTQIRKAAYDQRPTIEKSNKERKSDVISYHTSVMDRKTKGKAITVPYISLPIGKLKETRCNACSSSTMAKISCQKGLVNLSFSSSSAENVKETKKKLDLYGHASGRLDKGKAILSSPDCALGRTSGIGKDIADAPRFSLDERNCKKEGILKRTRSSVCERYLSPSTSLVGVVKDVPKSVNITDSVPDKTKIKGKVTRDPFNTTGSSATETGTSQPLRMTSEKNKNVVGASSCPPIMRSKKIQNDFDEAADIKYLNSWTDQQAKVREARTMLSLSIFPWDGDERSGDERWDALLRKTRAFLESYAFIRQGCADVTDVGLCRKCKKKDDYDLLLCTTSFCLVAVHKHCLGYMPAMKGRFYCAFCSYAHLLSQLEDIEKEMGVARNNIATFLGKENDSDEDCDAKNILIPSEDKTKEESSRKKVRHGRHLKIPRQRRAAVPWGEAEVEKLKEGMKLLYNPQNRRPWSMEDDSEIWRGCISTKSYCNRPQR